MALKETEILTLTDVPRAARILASGGLVVFPTETVWGLGANAKDPDACVRIFEAKGRPQDNPLIVHVADFSVLSRVAHSLCRAEVALIEAFMPGPLTLIVPRSDEIPEVVTGGRADVGVRMPREPTARALLAECGLPVAAPSANRSGRPSPTTFAMAKAAMWGRVDAIMEGPPSEVGLESTVVRVRQSELQILRPGAVTAEELALAVPSLTQIVAGSEPIVGGPSAPGLKYPHYKPRATVVVVETRQQLIESSRLARSRGPCAVLWPAPECDPALVSQLPEGIRICTFDDIPAYARGLFAWFHELDADRTATIIAKLPPDHGLGSAVRNRLIKAADEIAP